MDPLDNSVENSAGKVKWSFRLFITVFTAGVVSWTIIGVVVSTVIDQGISPKVIIALILTWLAISLWTGKIQFYP